jgi:hypothetical protein
MEPTAVEELRDAGIRVVGISSSKRHMLAIGSGARK